jgi:hypothetical protein
MKIGLLTLAFFISQLCFAQTLNEKKIKSEMIERTELLIIKANDAREAIKVEDMARVCDRIDEMFKTFPDHLMSIGQRMDLFKKKIIKLENETKMFLIDVHRRSLICQKGIRGEHLDIKETDQQLKGMIKSLKKQKKIIEKEDVGFENSYSYYYEFK